MLTLAEVLKGILSFIVIGALSVIAFLSDPEKNAPLSTHTAQQEAPSLKTLTPRSPATSTSPSADEGTQKRDAPLAKPEAVQQDTAFEEEPTIPPPRVAMREETPLLTLENDFAQINERARKSIVNVFCQTRDARTVKTVTGSGVLVDARGVVLTNAHIAQFFLIPDYPTKGATKCTVRTGNPARDMYHARLLYIPITWVQAHASDINVKAPSGTGEGDYALLYITDPVDASHERPSVFPHLPLDLAEITVESDESVLIVSYPALIANSDTIKNNLFLVSTVTKTGTLFTFRGEHLDLFGLDGNIAAQKGSSGGAVVNKEGALVGMIVTSTGDALVLDRELRALTPSYINRNLEQENGTSLPQLFFGDPKLRSSAFMVTTAPILTKLLTTALQNEN